MALMPLDPNVRKEFLEAATNLLFKKYINRLRKEKLRLISMNSHAWKNNCLGLRYLGISYYHGIVVNKETNPLHPTVRAEFKEYLKQQIQLDREIAMAMGYFKLILTRTVHLREIQYLTPQMYHSIFPRMVHQFIYGPGPLRQEELDAIKVEYQPYYDLLQARMAYNFLDTSPA